MSLYVANRSQARQIIITLPHRPKHVLNPLSFLHEAPQLIIQFFRGLAFVAPKPPTATALLRLRNPCPQILP